jgi:hypothetical protein
MEKGFFKGFFNSEKTNSAEELLFMQKKQGMEEMAKQQAISTGISSYWTEAKRIAEACGIFRAGPRGCDNPGLFVTSGLEILQHEPELAYAVLSQMNRLEPEIGYKPAGRLMVTLGQMDSMSRSPIMAKASYLMERPELLHLTESRDYRCRKAGKLLAVGVLSAGQTIFDAARIYRLTQFDPSVKLSLDKDLRSWNLRIAEKIIKQ